MSARATLIIPFVYCILSFFLPIIPFILMPPNVSDNWNRYFVAKKQIYLSVTFLVFRYYVFPEFCDAIFSGGLREMICYILSTFSHWKLWMDQCPFFKWPVFTMHRIISPLQTCFSLPSPFFWHNFYVVMCVHRITFSFF